VFSTMVPASQPSRANTISSGFARPEDAGRGRTVCPWMPVKPFCLQPAAAGVPEDCRPDRRQPGLFSSRRSGSISVLRSFLATTAEASRSPISIPARTLPSGSSRNLQLQFCDREQTPPEIAPSTHGAGPGYVMARQSRACSAPGSESNIGRCESSIHRIGDVATVMKQLFGGQSRSQTLST